MTEIPPLSVDLIDQLDERYPPISPHEYLASPERELMVRAAERRLVETLKAKLAQDHDEDL